MSFLRKIDEKWSRSVTHHGHPKKSNVRAVAEWCWFVLFASAGGLIVALGFVCLWAGDHLYEFADRWTPREPPQ